jgi:single-strand DNA-binding protein
MNIAVLIGNLTRDIEMRYTQTGKAVANFTIAVNRPFKNAQGEYDADFIPIVVWDKLAENCANFLKKGSRVGVSGRIQVRTYDDKQGIRRYITEIIANEVKFLDGKEKNDDFNSNDVPGFNQVDVDLPF